MYHPLLTTSLGSCASGAFCLIDGYCCPNGEDPKACALSNSVALPATFVGPTTTPVVSNSGSSSSSYVPATATAAATLQTSSAGNSQTASSTTVATFTGAANEN